jgi:hypothetical protein
MEPLRTVYVHFFSLAFQSLFPLLLTDFLVHCTLASHICTICALIVHCFAPAVCIIARVHPYYLVFMNVPRPE